MAKLLYIPAFMLVLVLAGCGRHDHSPQQVAEAISIDQLHPAIVPIYSDPSFGPRCGMPLRCNDIVRIDCGSDADGPLNYYDNTTGEVVMYCGGACMLSGSDDPKICKKCPPTDWICVLPPL